MINNNVVEIPLSKKKLFLLLIGATVFVVFGILFLLYPETFISTQYRSFEFIRIAGVATVSFFGLCFIYTFYKLFDNNVGLKIDGSGITDNSSGTSVGLIEWEDITELRSIEINSVKTLQLITDVPEKYIERASNPISRQMLNANYKMYGSPLSIATVGLKISFDELETLVSDRFNKIKH